MTCSCTFYHIYSSCSILILLQLLECFNRLLDDDGPEVMLGGSKIPRAQDELSYGLRVFDVWYSLPCLQSTAEEGGL